MNYILKEQHGKKIAVILNGSYLPFSCKILATTDTYERIRRLYVISGEKIRRQI